MPYPLDATQTILVPNNMTVMYSFKTFETGLRNLWTDTHSTFVDITINLQNLNPHRLSLNGSSGYILPEIFSNVANITVSLKSTSIDHDHSGIEMLFSFHTSNKVGCIKYIVTCK